jgi:hypothetical protein
MKFESSSAISKGLGNALETLAEVGSLPPIRGVWWFVDPKSGADTSDGRTMDTALKGIRAAYDKCTDSAGDGICIMSRSSATTADTTCYLGGSLIWAKYGITVVGLGAGQVHNNRARIATKDRARTFTTQVSWTTTTLTDTRGGLEAIFNVGDAILATVTAGTAITVINKVTAVTDTTLTLASAVTANATPGAGTISTHCVPLLSLTGANNLFYNVAFIQQGDTTADLGCVSISGAGADNHFVNCWFNGGGDATSGGETGCYDLELGTSECVFDGCIFGSNATTRNAASAHIILGISTTAIGQDYFNDCRVISKSSTAGHLGISITNAATLGGWVQFKGCSFVNWYSGAVTALTNVIGGTDTDNMGLLFWDCAMVGWAIWANAGWDMSYTADAVAAPFGGRAILTD